MWPSLLLPPILSMDKQYMGMPYIYIVLQDRYMSRSGKYMDPGDKNRRVEHRRPVVFRKV